MVKKYITAVALLCLMLGMGGCGGQEQQSNGDLVDSYKQTAQQYIDAGDVAYAQAVLEEGIAQTGDPSLQQMLDGLTNQQQTNHNVEIVGLEETTETSATTVPIETSTPYIWMEIMGDNLNVRTGAGKDYDVQWQLHIGDVVRVYELSGGWGRTEWGWISLEFVKNYIGTEPFESSQPTKYEPKTKNYSAYEGIWGNLIITDMGEYMLVEYFSSSYDGMRVASMEERVYYSQIADDHIKFAYEDSWGNTGVMELKFRNNAIDVKISDVEYGYGALWGIYEESFTATRS